jgi:serine/threonine protein kinase
MLVMEFCANGSLDVYLKQHSTTPQNRLTFACDCAEGLAYLSSLNFVHRDVAARNVLLDDNLCCKISDYGHMREKIYDEVYQSTNAFAIRWMAPECYDGTSFSSKSDCWSFGVLLWEIWSRAQQPFADVTLAHLAQTVLAGIKLSQPEDCPLAVYNIMRSCWCLVPADRPSLEHLVIQFRELVSLEETTQFVYAVPTNTLHSTRASQSENADVHFNYAVPTAKYVPNKAHELSLLPSVFETAPTLANDEPQFVYATPSETLPRNATVSFPEPESLALYEVPVAVQFSPSASADQSPPLSRVPTVISPKSFDVSPATARASFPMDSGYQYVGARSNSALSGKTFVNIGKPAVRDLGLVSGTLSSGTDAFGDDLVTAENDDLFYGFASA